MNAILIGTKNPHKQRKLREIVASQYAPVIPVGYPNIKETGKSFQEIAERKALQYARWFNGLAVSTDGGSVIPALTADEWKPFHTRRFAQTDEERIMRLLDLMRGKSDRRVQWFEAIAVADPKQVLFSTTVQAMDGVLDERFDPKHYRAGIWLCSITSFPQFGGKNFFELSLKEQEQTEDSWEKLGEAFRSFFSGDAKTGKFLG